MTLLLALILGSLAFSVGFVLGALWVSYHRTRDSVVLLQMSPGRHLVDEALAESERLHFPEVRQ